MAPSADPSLRPGWRRGSAQDDKEGLLRALTGEVVVCRPDRVRAGRAGAGANGMAEVRTGILTRRSGGDSNCERSRIGGSAAGVGETQQFVHCDRASARSRSRVPADEIDPGFAYPAEVGGLQRHHRVEVRKVEVAEDADLPRG